MTGPTVRQMKDWLASFEDDQEVCVYMRGEDRLDDVRMIREPGGTDPGACDYPMLVVYWNDDDDT